MRTHLRTQHPDEYKLKLSDEISKANLKSSSKKNDITSFFPSIPSRKRDHPKLHNTAMMLVTAGLPFELTKNEFFKKLVEIPKSEMIKPNAPRYKAINVKNVKAEVEEIAKVEKENIKQLIKSKFLYAKIDFGSKSRRSFLGKLKNNFISSHFLQFHPNFQ